MADRFHVRGAYLDETIRLWRHLWSGSTEPFHGRFHVIDDFAFGPLPAQAPLPIVVGGRDERALRRAGTLADGYHSSAVGPAAYAGARRRSSGPRPRRPGARRRGSRPGCASRPARRPAAAMRCAARRTTSRRRSGAWAALGTTHLALYFDATDPAELVAGPSGSPARSNRSSDGSWTRTGAGAGHPPRPSAIVTGGHGVTGPSGSIDDVRSCHGRQDPEATPEAEEAEGSGRLNHRPRPAGAGRSPASPSGPGRARRAVRSGAGSRGSRSGPRRASARRARARA